MNSLKCLLKISKETLNQIQGQSESLGYSEAVRQELDFSEYPIEELKQRALAHFIDLSTGSIDGFLVERAWIHAYADLMSKDGLVEVYFPHIDNLTTKKTSS